MVDAHGAEFGIGEPMSDRPDWDPDGTLLVGDEESGITDDHSPPWRSAPIRASRWTRVPSRCRCTSDTWTGRWPPSPVVHAGADARRAKGWRVPVVLVIVGAFVVIEALGCATRSGSSCRVMPWLPRRPDPIRLGTRPMP